MGETQNQPFQLSLDPSLKVDFQGSRVTFDSGLLLVRYYRLWCTPDENHLTVLRQVERGMQCICF